jgi:hypothetical protein
MFFLSFLFFLCKMKCTPKGEIDEGVPQTKCNEGTMGRTKLTIEDMYIIVISPGIREFRCNITTLE